MKPKENIFDGKKKNAISTSGFPVAAEEFRWSPDFLQQVSHLSCIPDNYYVGTTLRHRSRAGTITKLGKVADMEVCALLCCEVETCDLALLESNICFSVQCTDRESCEIERATGTTGHKVDSSVVEMRRKYGRDVWSNGRNPNEVTADKYNENKSTIVTKQAVTSNMTAVQKSSIPDSQLQQHAAEAAYQDNKGSFITISSQDKSTSPMDQLLQKESSLLKSRAKLSGKGADLAKNDKKDNGAPSVSDKIQDLSEHLKKVDDKGDMTALEENETSSVHPKIRHHHKHDLKHTLISPITIGAFTCMAVIAVSGFAMALIKYQRERHINQSTQTLASN